MLSTDIRSLKTKLYIVDECIEHVNCFSFLGIMIDELLGWKTHREMVAFSFDLGHHSIQISGYYGVLNRTKKILSLCILRNLYHNMTYPHINCGLLVWRYVYSVTEYEI